MSKVIEVKVPDIGDVAEVDVIEVLVAEGDTISKEQSMITVESHKASMQIPSTPRGEDKSLKVKLGDKVAEGTVILELEAGAEASGEKPAAQGKSSGKPSAAAADTQAQASTQTPAPAASQANGGNEANQTANAAGGSGSAAASQGSGGRATVIVPDIGDATDVDVIEVMVAVGDTVDLEQSLITVESDKASMEVPSSHAGVVKEVLVKVGDKVNQGDEIVIVELTSSEAAAGVAGENPAADAAPAPLGGMNEPDVAPEANAQAEAEETSAPAQRDNAEATTSAPVVSGGPSQLASAPPERHSPTEAFASADVPMRTLPHASPSVRKFARELGVDLTKVKAAAPKNRIKHDDVRAYVKQALAQGPAAGAGAPLSGEGGLSVLPWPKIDFTKFGEIEERPLSRIKKISGANLHRNWAMIPHVTNNDVADITELEAFRKQLNKEQEKSGIKVTMLAFIIKAVVAALKKFPDFNASLDGDNLVLKKYFHIGFAADTPNGLVVPVIRDADRKGILELAEETAELARLARDGKLSPTQMQGGCFSISSLGGIGGTDFTPIINAPEVAILGVSRSTMQPVWNGKKFEPRLMLPLSLSYDHRVIDGAAAARFNVYLASLLADFRRIIL